MSIDELNTEATKNENETSENSEKKSDILDSFLNQIEEPNKTWVEDVFTKDDKLKDLFERNLKSLNLKDRIQAKNDLLKCKTPADVLNFIKDHQGHKIGSSISEIDTEKKESTEKEEIKARTDTEQAEKEEIKARTDTEQAEKEEIKARTNTEQAEEGEKNVDALKIMNDAIQARENLLKNHPDKEKAKKLDKDTRKKAEDIKNKLSERTKKQLEEKGYDDNFINDYILVRVTLNEVKNDSSFDRNQVAQFEKSVNKLSSMDIFLKNIDNECNIPDTRLSSFSKENIGQTRTELFNDEVGNQSLIKARNNNKENRDYSNIFHAMSDEKLINKYGSLLEGDFEAIMVDDNLKTKVKEFWREYKADTNLQGELKIMKSTPRANELYKDNPKYINYINMLSVLQGIKINVEEKTKDMMEEMCLITQINAMAKCIGQESFSLNKANEIKYDETGAMVLDGHIDGVNFLVRHNFDEDWSYLQTSSKLVKAENTNANNPENNSLIEIGGEGRFENSPFKLPGKESIFGMVSDVVASTEFSGENFDSVDDYIDNMQEGIVGKMDDVFDKDAEAANDYMKGQIKREEAIQETDKFIRNFEDGSEFTGIVNSSNKKLYDFLNIMNFNIKNIKNPEKSEEMNKLIEVMRRINKMAELGKNNSKASELNNHADNFGKYLTGDSLLNTRKILKNENVDDKTPSAFDLFKNYKKENDSRNIGELYMLDFQQIDRTLNVVETTSAIVADAKKSGSEADELLKNASSLWPPDSTVSMA